MYQQNRRAPTTYPLFSRPFNPHQPSGAPPSAPCTYCHPPQANTHTTLTCFKLEQDKKALSVNSETIVDYNDDEGNKYSYHTYDRSVPNAEEEEEEQKPQYQNKQYQHYNSVSVISCHVLNTAQLRSIPQSPVKISKINIYNSPILAVLDINEKTIYHLLDTEATSSLITKYKTDELCLSIFPTTHKAVQVDGESDLKVIREVHTTFTHSSTKLSFSVLVVNKMGTPILASTNFHMENDIVS